MTAPFVARMNDEIAACTDLAVKAELTARLGCYFARSGDVDTATQIAQHLRDTFGDGKQPRISVYIIILEGLTLFFKGQDGRALDRISRAYVLANAMGQRDLITLSASWLAHGHFHRSNYEVMSRYLEASRAHQTESDFDARCRFAMVLASVSVLAGNRPSAQHWFNQTREIVLSQGDQAAMGAAIYNRAAYMLYTARVADAISPSPELSPRLIEAEVETAISYHRVARLSSLDHWMDLLQIGAAMLAGKYADARNAISAVLDDVSLPLTDSENTILKFDFAVCEAKLGDGSGLEQLLGDSAFCADLARVDDGERAIIITSASRALAGRGIENFPFGYRDRLAQAARDYHATQVQLSEFVQRFVVS